VSLAYAQYFPQIAAAWKESTGSELLGWTNPDQAALPSELEQPIRRMTTPTAWVQTAGQTWLAARSQSCRPPFALAALTNREPDRHLMGVLAALLDQLCGTQDANGQLLQELGTARGRLDFLLEMARFAAETSDLPLMFSHLTQMLLQVVVAEDVCLILEEQGWLQAYTASGRIYAGLASEAITAAPSSPILIVRRGRNMPAALARLQPQIQNLILLSMPLDRGGRGLLGLINPPDSELRAGDRQLLFSAVEQISALINSTRLRAREEQRRRLDQELTIAGQIQENFLPPLPPSLAGVDFAVSLKPAYRIGGDFYDVQPVRNGLAVIVGDVAGKGLPAAMLTALIHATLKSEVERQSEPAGLLTAVNRLIYDELDRSESFITAFLAVLQTDPLRLSYASAGHTTTLLWRAADSSVVTLESTGLPLGIYPRLEIEQRSLLLLPGDVLMLYSDGITEAENQGGRVFGMQALIDLLLATHTAPTRSQIRTILSALELHRGGLPLQDDVVLFMARAHAPQDAARVVPFIYPAEKSSVRLLATEVRRLTGELEFAWPAGRAAYLNELELAVSEIATNIIVHAYRDQPDHGRIQGRVTLSPSVVQVDLVDTGLPFEPAGSLTGSPSADPLLDPPAGGYGLMIARRLLDVCRYSRETGGRNHWELVKYI
jgi:serine phosphatase RsbU (regulator of sigma subunit)/anti-sigma regulatory factor (Ser/Thr protein kinase)